MRTCTPNLCCQVRRSNPCKGAQPLRRLDDWHPQGADPAEGRHEGSRLGGALPGRQDSTHARLDGSAGVGLREGARRARQPLCTRATRASAASRRRDPCTTTRIPGPAGGPEPTRRSAASTSKAARSDARAPEFQRFSRQKSRFYTMRFLRKDQTLNKVEKINKAPSPRGV